MGFLYCFVIVLALGMLGAPSAMAQPAPTASISFVEPATEGALLVPTTDIPSAVVTPGIEQATVSFVLPFQASAQTFTVAYTEPGTPSILSDLVTVTVVDAGIVSTVTVVFQSDFGEGGLLPVTPPIFSEAEKVEGNRFLFSFVAGEQSFPVAVFVQSDVETVPEPASVVLVASGLFGVAVVASKRRRT